MKLLDQINKNEELSIELVELKGFSRSIAELEWLLLILVILYTVSPGSIVTDQWGIILSCLFFTAFVLSFHYLNFYEKETRWKLAIEVWIMIAFVTWVLWHTGKIDSPLLNLYIMIIITSGLTLGKLTTLLILLLITTVYIYMGFPVIAGSTLSLENFTRMMSIFSPYLLVAYLTTMLSADLQFARRMFKQLADTDEMTGFHNTRSFTKILVSEIKQSMRYDRKFSILMTDADNLKEINDNYGHAAGDKMIKIISDTINHCLRESDTLARYGGDEFIVLLPETDKIKALEAADRIRVAIENTSFDMKGNPVNSTISIGVATFPKDGDNLEAILQSADNALYQAKSKGRNLVV